MKRIFLPLLFSLGVFAQDEPAPVVLSRLETMDGKVYEGLTKVKITANRLSFQHAGGLASVKLERLPEELRVALGYDPVAAAAAEKRERDMEAEHYAAVEQMAADIKNDEARKKSADKVGIMQAVELSRAVSDYTRYQDLYRWMAAQQREQDLRNAMDARYGKYGR